MAENLSLGKIFYQVNALDRDAGRNAEISYALLKCRTALMSAAGEDSVYHHHSESSSPLSRHSQSQSKSNVTTMLHGGDARLDGICTESPENTDGPMFNIDSRLGHLTLARPLDFEVAQRHTLLVNALDAGSPRRLSANLTIVIDVQDINDNSPQFERNEYNVQVLESMPINSQVIKFIPKVKTGNFN